MKSLTTKTIKTMTALEIQDAFSAIDCGDIADATGKTGADWADAYDAAKAAKAATARRIRAAFCIKREDGRWGYRAGFGRIAACEWQNAEEFVMSHELALAIEGASA